MNFDQFIREILRYDMEHMIIDTKRKRDIWDHVNEELSNEKSVKPEKMKYP
ncbi:MAG: hypothetical protein J5819_02600 [Eubacterium sp.]|nr:hypothetical protein [Eubacterium sp.]